MSVIVWWMSLIVCKCLWLIVNVYDCGCVVMNVCDCECLWLFVKVSDCLWLWMCVNVYTVRDHLWSSVIAKTVACLVCLKETTPFVTHPFLPIASILKTIHTAGLIKMSDILRRRVGRWRMNERHERRCSACSCSYLLQSSYSAIFPQFNSQVKMLLLTYFFFSALVYGE